MKSFTKSTLTIITLAFVMLPRPVSAAENVIGDWEILLIFPIKTNLRTSSASMTIAKDANGKYEGKWSTMRAGESSVSDVKFENDKLSFVVTGHIAEKEIKTTLTATVKGAKMTGKGFTSVAQFDFEGALEGEPKTGADAVVGKWQIKATDFPKIDKMTIFKNADGSLAGKWYNKSKEFQNEISDVNLTGTKLTFKLTMQNESAQRGITRDFEGAVKGDTITGVFKYKDKITEAIAKRVAPVKSGEPKKSDPNS